MTKYILGIMGGLVLAGSALATLIPQLQILTPNGGETVTQGHSLKIIWQSDRVGQVQLSLVNDQNVTARTIARSAQDTGVYDWLVPTDLTVGSYKIMVADSSGRDRSDGYFKVVAPVNHRLVVTHPNGGSLVKGRTYNISWAGNTNHSSLDIFLLKNGSPVGALKRVENAPVNGSWGWTINDNSVWDGSLETGSHYQIIIHRTLQNGEAISRSFNIVSH